MIAQHRLSHPGPMVVDGAALAADGGALFLGRDVIDIFHKHDAWVVRVDAGGQALWSHGFTRPGSGRHFLFDAAELTDGSWIACGATGLIDQPPQSGWLVRFSAAGAVLWQFEYGAGVADSLTSVTPTSDGGFIASGVTNSSGAGSDDAWVLKLDSGGAIEWQRTFGGAEVDQAMRIIELAGGGYALCGFTDSLTPSGHAPWVLGLDAGGGLVWNRTAMSDVWGDLYGLAETTPGELVVLGRVWAPGQATNDLWSAGLAAADGALHWQRSYAGASGDWGTAVLPLGGAGLVLGGVWGWGFPEEDVWLVRTDALGRLRGCSLENETKFDLVDSQITSAPGVALQLAPNPVLQATAFAQAPGNGLPVDRCP